MLDRDHLFSKEPERWWNWQREKAAGRLGLELMPKFAPQPENFKNRFDLPLLVNPKIPSDYLLQLCGIDTGGKQISRYKDKWQMPEKPYQIWVNSGTNYKATSVEEAALKFNIDEQPLSMIEGLNLFFNYPDLFDEKTLIFAGSVDRVFNDLAFYPALGPTRYIRLVSPTDKNPYYVQIPTYGRTTS